MQFQKNSNPCNRNKILKSKLKKKYKTKIQENI